MRQACAACIAPDGISPVSMMNMSNATAEMRAIRVEIIQNLRGQGDTYKTLRLYEQSRETLAAVDSVTGWTRSARRSLAVLHVVHGSAALGENVKINLAFVIYCV